MKLRDFIEALNALPADIILEGAEVVMYSSDGVAVALEDSFSIFKDESNGETLIVLTAFNPGGTLDSVGLPINEIPF